MRYRQLSPTGDFLFGAGQANFLTNSPEAVAQVVQTYLLLFLGEWYLNVNDGTPWLQDILGYNSQADADQALISVIVSLPGVQDLKNWSSTQDPVTRKYTSINAILDTIYGETQLQLENIGANS